MNTKSFAIVVTNKAGDNNKCSDSVWETIHAIKKFYDGSKGFSFSLDEIAYQLSDTFTRKQVAAAIGQWVRYGHYTRISNGNYEIA